MTGGIFLIQADETLVEMTDQPYDSENLLQELLAKYPSLLAGDQMAAVPRRWLLIAREMSLPSEKDGAGRWSVDHLFLDQDAVPTLVEVKRASDGRIRREVVGQMLDYAANAVVYWPVEQLRATFDATEGSTERLATFLDTEDPEVFWEQVETNLQVGKVRLVFIADVIPQELRRIVEFLNAQMNPAEVIAVEIKQYVGQDLRTLVPRVVGQTAEAQQRKGRREGKQWDEQSFLAETGRKTSQVETGVARAVLDYWSQKRFPLRWGKGAVEGTVTLALDVAGSSYTLFYFQTDGKMAINFAGIASKPPFDQDSKRLALLRRFNDIPGVNLPESAINGAPRIPLATFAPPDALAKLFEVTEWFLTEAQTRGGSPDGG